MTWRSSAVADMYVTDRSTSSTAAVPYVVIRPLRLMKEFPDWHVRPVEQIISAVSTWEDFLMHIAFLHNQPCMIIMQPN